MESLAVSSKIHNVNYVLDDLAECQCYDSKVVTAKAKNRNTAYPTLSPYTGAMPGIKAFTAAVFGGIGSIPGALIGGILLGVIEILGRAYISSQLSDAIVFAVLIIVLLVKPTGLLGKQVQEKV